MGHTLRDTHTGKLYEVDDNEEHINSTDTDYGTNVVARIVSLVAGIILALLGLRFVLMLFGANPANAIVDFIYSASLPFVAPFFGIFNYDQQLGTARFEFETLIAMAVYALIAWLIIRLVTVGNRRQVV